MWSEKHAKQFTTLHSSWSQAPDLLEYIVDNTCRYKAFCHPWKIYSGQVSKVRQGTFLTSCFVQIIQKFLCGIKYMKPFVCLKFWSLKAELVFIIDLLNFCNSFWSSREHWNTWYISYPVHVFFCLCKLRKIREGLIDHSRGFIALRSFLFFSLVPVCPRKTPTNIHSQKAEQ